MHVMFMTSVAVVSSDPSRSRKLYIDGLGLPLERKDGEYFATEALEGSKHFGVWPLEQAAQSCFGTTTWPKEYPVPKLCVEFELESIDAISAAVAELQAKGYSFLHGPKTEPWGQTVARLLNVDHEIVGLSFSPWLHESESKSPTDR